MTVSIKKITSVAPKDNIILITGKKKGWTELELSKQEEAFAAGQIHKNDKKFITLNRFDKWIFIQLVEEKKESHLTIEAARKAGAEAHAVITANKLDTVTLIDDYAQEGLALAFAEGLALNNYQFLKYKTNAEKEQFSLKQIKIYSKKTGADQLAELEVLIDATFKARDLVNEPVCFLTAVQLGKEIEKMGKEAGSKVEVLKKNRIEALKMGGLLSVNKGSIDPPTFSIIEYKPQKAKNKKPYVLVGKGVVYDTGGLSLKPTPNSMDQMKCDMAGAAAVSCAVYAIAKAKLPVHVIALVPATDNRPGENAYTPGDVITLHNGKTVEVLNTDAEGRLILGDALSYAQKYKPELVIDLATLTGAAHAAVGQYGIVAMGTAGETQKDRLKKSGNNVFERLVEFPFWEEYGELIKSDVAEIKNIGGPVAGAITAGKFLEHFTDYPWIHLDIAGPAFTTAKDSYRGKGGTGVGVRLLFNFFKSISDTK